ncbi:hypothetical protein ACOMHN_054017 [Nucella lapillus]
MNTKLISNEFKPLTLACGRALTDKCYQKRKCAALQVERVVRGYVLRDKHEDVFIVLKLLGGDLAYSDNVNTRKGGLIGLAAAAIALKKDSHHYIHELVLPALASFHHCDLSVQYQACEAVFNIIKVVRSKILPFFIEVFDGLSKLTAHPDEEVRGAASLVDRLLKDIVTESPAFDLMAFIPLLRERIYAVNIHARYFILSWIETLDSAPDMDMLVFLPEILDGLLLILGEENSAASRLCQNVLAEFLEALHHRKERAVNFEALVNILVLHSQSGFTLAGATALHWLTELSALSPATMLPHLAGMLHAVLPSLADQDPGHHRVRCAGEALNSRLYDLVRSSSHEDRHSSTPAHRGDNPQSGGDTLVDAQSGTESGSTEPVEIVSVLPVLLQGTEPVEIVSVLPVLLQYVGHSNVQTRLAVLKWIHHLLTSMPHQMFDNVHLFFQQLMQTLLDTSEEVVLTDLFILCDISSSACGQRIDVNLFAKSGQKLHTVPPALRDIVQSCQCLGPFFPHFMVELVAFFQRHLQLFEDRGAFIVRHLALSLGADAVLSSLAEILLCQGQDTTFVLTLTRALSTILLTATEMFELRCQLKALNTKTTQNSSSEKNLNRWPSVDLDMTMDILKEIDKLVQLLESPVFAYLRMHLLAGERSADLVRSLYGLLMLLPQSEAFRLLKGRLECVPPPLNGSSAGLADAAGRCGAAVKGGERDLQTSDIPFSELVEHFVTVQTAHRRVRMEQQAGKLSQQSAV